MLGTAWNGPRFLGQRVPQGPGQGKTAESDTYGMERRFHRPHVPDKFLRTHGRRRAAARYRKTRRVEPRTGADVMRPTCWIGGAYDRGGAPFDPSFLGDKAVLKQMGPPVSFELRPRVVGSPKRMPAISAQTRSPRKITDPHG
jgi:hypothetical protein